MQRIDDPSAATSMPVPEAAGTPGYWTEGNPTTGVPATLERASWFNSIQEELMSILTAGGITPSKTTFNQVLTALQAMYGVGRPGHVFTSNDWVPLPGGLILQWGTGSGSASIVTTTLPIAFPNAVLARVVSLQDKTSGSLGLSIYSQSSLLTKTSIGASMAAYDSGSWSFGYLVLGY